MVAAQPRSRLLYAFLVVLTIALGLASRKFSFLLPPLLAKNAGDVLYATMAFWLVGFLLPHLSTVRTALAAMGFCVGIEFLKFAPWLAAVRHSRAGALVLGSGFHVSNMVCYAVGVALAASLEMVLRRTRA